MISQSKSVYFVNLFSKYLLALLQGWKTKKTKSNTAAYATDGNIKRTTITLFNSLIHSVRESVGKAAGRSGVTGSTANFKPDWVNYHIKIDLRVTKGKFEPPLFGRPALWFRSELYNLFKELIF